jgi:hypothetical protein
MRRSLLVVLSIAASVSHAQSPAPRETLAQKEYWTNQMDYSQRTVDEIKTHCGAAPSFAFDRASWWPHKDALAAKAVSPYGRCDDALIAIRDVCMGNPDAAARVKEAIKSVHCGYGGDDAGFKIELQNGALRYDVEVNKPNPREALSDYLKAQL